MAELLDDPYYRPLIDQALYSERVTRQVEAVASAFGVDADSPELKNVAFALSSVALVALKEFIKALTARAS